MERMQRGAGGVAQLAGTIALVGSKLEARAPVAGTGPDAAVSPNLEGAKFKPISDDAGVQVRNAKDLGEGVREVPQVQETPQGPTAAKGGATEDPVWSSTKTKTSEENAQGHFDKHGSEFPEHQNAKQYVQGAKDFVSNPPKGTLTKVRPSGDTLFYDPKTNTFAVRAANGAPRTMFRPTDGIDYWNKQ